MVPYALQLEYKLYPYTSVLSAVLEGLARLWRRDSSDREVRIRKRGYGVQLFARQKYYLS